MEARLISTNADYERTLAEIKRLWRTPQTVTNRRKMELLAMLANRYEREREPLPESSPIEAIRFRMEQQGLTRKDLLPIFGTSARVSEVLNGKRKLTLEMIRELHERLDIPLESLIKKQGKKTTRAA